MLAVLWGFHILPIHTHTHSYHDIEANSQIVFGFNKDTINWQTFSSTPLLNSLKLHLFVYLFVFRNTQSWPQRLFPLFFIPFPVTSSSEPSNFWATYISPFFCPFKSGPSTPLHRKGGNSSAIARPALYYKYLRNNFQNMIKNDVFGFMAEIPRAKIIPSHPNLTSIRTCLIVS